MPHAALRYPKSNSELSSRGTTGPCHGYGRFRTSYRGKFTSWVKDIDSDCRIFIIIVRSLAGLEADLRNTSSKLEEVKKMFQQKQVKQEETRNELCEAQMLAQRIQRQMAQLKDNSSATDFYASTIVLQANTPLRQDTVHDTSIPGPDSTMAEAARKILERRGQNGDLVGAVHGHVAEGTSTIDEENLKLSFLKPRSSPSL